MSAIFGLDFGTSNTALSVNMDGHVKMLDIDPSNPVQKTLKSILYFYKDDMVKEVYTGYQAVEKYVEYCAEGRYIQSIKSFLPDKSFEKTEIYRTYYTLEELIACIIKTVKDRGEKLLNREIHDVVIGRPVVFSDDDERDQRAESRLLKAAELAGFRNIYFQLEPIAAALSYENSLQSEKEVKILVADFGAGTSDFTIFKTSSKSQRRLDRKQDILSVGGVYVGGDSFDSSIMWNKICGYYGKGVKAKSLMSDNYQGISPLVLEKLKHWHLIPQLRTPKTIRYIEEFKYLADAKDKKLIENLQNLIELNYGYMLFRAIEKAKCSLSGSDLAAIIYSQDNLLINEEITREHFENIIKKDIDKIEACIDSIVQDAGLKATDIDTVFLTGGSSFIPLLKRIFERKFGGINILHTDAFTTVSYGLGLEGGRYI